MVSINKRGATKTVVIAVALAALAVIALGGYRWFKAATTNTYTAFFPVAASLYKGDPVRVLGVNVGTVDSITPRKGDVKVVLRVDKDVDIPADAKAVIVAQSLVTGRFVQLTPVFSSGEKLANNATIPMERTAVPMEWDDIKAQLSKLSESLGPETDGKGSDIVDRGAAAEAVDVLNRNLDGNGEAIRRSVTEMSDLMGTLSANRGDLFGTVRNLQKLTEALSQSHEELVQFNGRIASVSQVLSDNATELGDALEGLSSAVTDVKSFIDRNGAELTESVGKLADATKIVADKDEQLRGLLHSAPNQLANFQNIYNPLTGSLSGVFGLGMGTNLITLLCGTMDSTARPGTTKADIDHCVDVLAPVVSSISMNYPPFLTNPVSAATAKPSQIIYQNADVKARAQAGVARMDEQTRKHNRGSPLESLLVPFGAAG
ncbi:MCE family protein [Gordonia sp. (in: high G+C Gram-positive bacteria)]|uniref:MCE family protein n=1 Tax=Gordonia sp. (in: high G+C Gram-positive bacteria) TaxID=84139 RepID=UPI001DF78DC4|nr:MCE family protein [Gordonia sp. (in: high G+C Gram-positive bacteria)]MCB1293097.1 MCE family protein [Gordonia sp. (in: high G+C Gram-positive bacteria)]HMS74228.1 MCE family protein [Gordonia sp. (in: high G+C Gram-positive bacteria)]HQV20967.1 MCE family protein [Gordonia sp. (in: high G+C Gram-positive bacteria)]